MDILRTLGSGSLSITAMLNFLGKANTSIHDLGEDDTSNFDLAQYFSCSVETVEHVECGQIFLLACQQLWKKAQHNFIGQFYNLLNVPISDSVSEAEQTMSHSHCSVSLSLTSLTHCCQLWVLLPPPRHNEAFFLKPDGLWLKCRP